MSILLNVLIIRHSLPGIVFLKRISASKFFIAEHQLKL